MKIKTTTTIWIITICVLLIYFLLSNSWNTSSPGGQKCVEFNETKKVTTNKKNYDKCDREESVYKSERGELELIQQGISEQADWVRAIKESYPFDLAPEQEQTKLTPELTKNLNLIK